MFLAYYVFFLMVIWWLATLLIHNLNDLGGALGWYGSGLSYSDLRSVANIVLLLLTIEFILLLQLAASASHSLKYTKNAYGIFVGMLALTVCYLYLLFLTFSWAFVYVRGVFISLEDLSLFYYLTDFKNIENMASSGDFSFLGICLLAPLVILAFFVGASWNRASSIRTVCRYYLLGSVLILPVVSIIAYPSLADPVARRKIGFFLKVGSTPSLALMAEIVFRSDLSEDLPKIEIEKLIPSYSLTDYQNRIPSDYSPKQNIILIMIEALRNDVFLDSQFAKQIPNLGRLAQEGHYFERAFATATDTDYSIRAILTGLHPLKYSQRDINLDLDFPFFKIYDLLALGGYRTGLFAAEWKMAKRVSSSEYLDIHYDPQFDNEPLLVDRKRSPEKVRLGHNLPESDRMVIEKFLSWKESGHKHFLSVMYLMATHWPFVQCGKDDHLLTTPSFFSRTTQGVSLQQLNLFKGCLHLVDGFIGEIIEELQRAGDLDTTTIIITGDHGQEFGEHGGFGHSGALHEVVIRVPIIVWNAPKALRAIPTKSTVSHLDIAPSILTIAGLPSTKSFQGISLFYKDSRHPPQRAFNGPVYSTVQMITLQDAIVYWPYKLIRDLRLGSYALFNLKTDPEERNNLYFKLPHEAKLMKQELAAFRGIQLGYFRLPTYLRQEYFVPDINGARYVRELKSEGTDAEQN